MSQLSVYPQVNGPGGRAGAGLLRCVAPPQALDQLGGRRDLSVVVLLSLLLLNLQSETRPQDSLIHCYHFKSDNFLLLPPEVQKKK